jgi:hypothetical protein
MDRDLGSLMVSYLSHHDDVRVLSNDAAQTAGKGQSDLGAHLDLTDPRDLILDRVLNGQNVVVGE